jgi:hypothetical protein
MIDTFDKDLHEVGRKLVVGFIVLSMIALAVAALAGFYLGYQHRDTQAKRDAQTVRAALAAPEAMSKP